MDIQAESNDIKNEPPSLLLSSWDHPFSVLHSRQPAPIKSIKDLQAHPCVTQLGLLSHVRSQLC